MLLKTTYFLFLKKKIIIKRDIIYECVCLCVDRGEAKGHRHGITLRNYITVI